jgi:hypothetical protein
MRSETLLSKEVIGMKFKGLLCKLLTIQKIKRLSSRLVYNILKISKIKLYNKILDTMNLINLAIFNTKAIQDLLEDQIINLNMWKDMLDSIDLFLKISILKPKMNIDLWMKFLL